ncbi:MAG: ferritin-like domain-containing protein, partial [Gammaproteobacteria bacterium]
ESGSAFVTRELFESILDEEEDHVDWLETHLGLIDRVGLATIP